MIRGRPQFARAMFYSLYRGFAWPLLRCTFSIAGRFHQKIGAGLQLRQSSPWRVPALSHTSSPVVWFHCASGEFEYAKPVITELKARRADVRIIVTYFSPTFAKAVQNFPGVDLALPLPWDTPQDLTDFIQVQKPTLLLIARTDTWPELLRTAKDKGLSTLLFAATLSENSGRVRNPLARWMSRAIFSYLDDIFCVDEADLKAFTQLGVSERSRVAGDTRYDQVMYRLRSPKPVKDELFRDERPTLICGSTWSEDEAVLIQTAKQVPEIRFVFVPHEPTEEHLRDLETKLKNAGLLSIRYSTAQSWPEKSVLLVDKIGILAELYQKGQLAFVGGSFRKTVHSVMEPLASGCLTFVGPFHLNNREAVEFRGIPAMVGPSGGPSAGLSLVQLIEDSRMFSEKLRLALAALSPELADQIRQEVQARAGKSALVVDWILKNTPAKD